MGLKWKEISSLEGNFFLNGGEHFRIKMFLKFFGVLVVEVAGSADGEGGASECQSPDTIRVASDKREMITSV